MLPVQRCDGRWTEHCTIVNGMFWVLNSGSPWGDMPERYGERETVYRRWTGEGLFDRILRALHVSLDDQGRIDWSEFDVDGTNIRAHRSAAGASKNRPASPLITPWDDSAEALARSFIL